MTEPYGALVDALLEAAPAGALLIDDTLHVRAADREARSLLSEPQTIIGMAMSDLLARVWPPTEAGLAHELIRRVLATGEPYEGRFEGVRRLDRPDEESCAWRLHRLPLPGGRFGVICHYGAAVEHLHASAALRRSADRDAYRVALSDALRSMADAHAIEAEAARVAGEHFAANRVAVMEVQADEDTVVIHQDWHRDAPSIIGEHRLSIAATALLPDLRAGRTAVISDASALHPTDGTFGERQTMAAVAVPLVRAGCLQAVFVVTQTSPRIWEPSEVALIQETGERTWAAVERARAETALRESEARYRTILTAIDEGFCTIDILLDEAGKPADYRFVQFNPSFTRHTGLRDVEGRTALEMVPQRERFWIDTYGAVALSGTPAAFESYSTPLKRWFQVHASRVGGAGSLRVALVFSNITERKLALQALEEAHRRKDEFIATLAHELRNPLAPIRNALHLLRQADADASLTSRLLQMMNRQVHHVSRLVDDLMEVSRINRGTLDLQREPVVLASVAELAVEAAETLLNDFGHELVMELPAEPLTVHADLLRLVQVFSNLLNNAARYTPRGGRISLSAQREGDNAVVRIRDNGRGIASGEIDRIFEPFVQVERQLSQAQGGLGIGLTLARNLVLMHDGSIEADSAGPGFGSTFTVRLPLQSPSLQPPLPVQDTAGADTAETVATTVSGRRILVVDDNVDAADSLAMLLQRHGAQVRVAYDGLRALHEMENFVPDAVLLDLGMPGMDGFEVAGRIRERHGSVRPQLIALTGWGQHRDRRRTRRAGFDHHLTKPISMQELLPMLAPVRLRH